MLKKKNPFKSKTIQGILVSVFPWLLSKVGVDVINAEALAGEVMTVLGTLWAIYGRYSAKEKIGFGND